MLDWTCRQNMEYLLDKLAAGKRVTFTTRLHDANGALCGARECESINCDLGIPSSNSNMIPATFESAFVIALQLLASQRDGTIKHQGAPSGFGKMKGAKTNFSSLLRHS